ncbi:MAG: TetR/AcrR family transcriptional regulator [Rhizobiaceae bacterium]
MAIDAREDTPADAQQGVKLNETANRGSPRLAARQSRDQILEAAAECFKENGFAATSIDDVAYSLGATKGMIYHHFRSKIDLFFAVYQRGMEINFEATEPETHSHAKPLERLARMSMAHSVALMAHQPFQRVLAQGVAMHQTGSTTAAQRDTLSTLIKTRDTYEELFRTAIEAAVADSGTELTNPSLASKSFLAVLNSTVFWYSPRRRNATAEQISIALDLVNYALRGLGLHLPEDAIDDWKKHL